MREKQSSLRLSFWKKWQTGLFPACGKNQEVSGLLDRLLEGEERKLYLAVFDRGDFPLSSQVWERDRSWRGFLLPPLLVLEHHFCTLWITGEVRQPEPALQDLATFFGVESPQMVPVTFQNLFDQVEAAEDKMCYFYHLNGEQEGRLRRCSPGIGDPAGGGHFATGGGQTVPTSGPDITRTGGDPFSGSCCPGSAQTG